MRKINFIAGPAPQGPSKANAWATAPCVRDVLDASRRAGPLPSHSRRAQYWDLALHMCVGGDSRHAIAESRSAELDTPETGPSLRHRSEAWTAGLIDRFRFGQGGWSKPSRSSARSASPALFPAAPTISISFSRIVQQTIYHAARSR